MFDFINTYEKEPVIELKNQVLKDVLVSVCVQAYQQVEYINQCLDSILEQKTNFKFEILLGDDESTDGTREICIEYAKKNPGKIRLFLHNRKNNIKLLGKPSGRFNFLYNLSKANGKYIALCEGDDYWTDPLKLQKQVEFMENNPDYAICYHKIDILDEIGKFKQIEYNENPNVEYSIDDILTRTAQITTQSICFRNVFRENIPDWMTYFKSGDYPLFAYLAHFGKIKFFDEAMSVYRKNHGGVTNEDEKYFVKWYLNYIHGYDKINSQLNFEYDESFAKAQARYYYLAFWKLRINKGRFFSLSFLLLEFFKHKCLLSHKLLIFKFLINLFSNFKKTRSNG